MTTKRIVIILGTVVMAVGLLIVIFVGGIVGFALYAVGNSLKVIGERRTVNATVALVYRDGRPWRVTSASYRDEAGHTDRSAQRLRSPTTDSPPGCLT